MEESFHKRKADGRGSGGGNRHPRQRGREGAGTVQRGGEGVTAGVQQSMWRKGIGEPLTREMTEEGLHLVKFSQGDFPSGG